MQLLVLLIAADLALSVYIPAKDRQWYEQSVSGNSERFCRKIFDYICSNQDHQVLILGSSLSGVPSLCCDQTFVKSKIPYPYLPPTFEFSQYKRAEYFRQLLSKKLGTKLDVVNLGVAGTVASDHLAILEKAHQFGKTPSLVICTVAPAEFLWSNQDRIEQTRIRQAFKSYSWPMGNTSADFALDQVRREVAWHFDCAHKELSSLRRHMAKQIDKTLQRKSESTAPSTSENSIAANTSGNSTAVVASVIPNKSAQTTVSTAAESNHPARTDGEVAHADRWGRKNTLPDLAMYREQYSNFKPAILEQHLNNFAKMLDLCQKSNIPVVVVNMPLTKANKDLLAKPIYDRYHLAVSSLARQHNASFIDMDQRSLFARGDFFDSTHLNEEGGRKFFDALADKLSEHTLQQLATTPGRVY